MGSTTKHLIEKAPCPILSIPADVSHMPIKTIVYATDFEEEDVYAIRKLAEMAEQFDAEIKVIHISTKEEYKGERQMEWFKEMLHEKVKYGRIDFELLFTDDVFDALRIYLGDTGADLMVMLEREKGGFLKKWFQQLTGMLILKVFNTCPVLISISTSSSRRLYGWRTVDLYVFVIWCSNLTCFSSPSWFRIKLACLMVSLLTELARLSPTREVLTSSLANNLAVISVHIIK